MRTRVRALENAMNAELQQQNHDVSLGSTMVDTFPSSKESKPVEYGAADRKCRNTREYGLLKRRDNGAWVTEMVGVVSDYDLLALDSISGNGRIENNMFPEVDSSWKIFYLVGFGLFCLDTLLSLWVLQKVYLYFRGNK
ncbi:hypothetical protein K1719_044448 [Acacia pycnantha]|nr:hypothetical protein K1719_044448 [Acacia pycnantha]